MTQEQTNQLIQVIKDIVVALYHEKGSQWCNEKIASLNNIEGAARQALSTDVAKENIQTDVGEQDEKIPRLIKWANDGFPPIDLSNEFNAVMELIRAYQSLTRK